MIRVCSFESRRAAEMSGLIQRSGAQAFVAPSMQELALTDQAEVYAFCDLLWRDAVDTVIFLTGVGAQQLLKAVELRYPADQFVHKLAGCTLVARGPKPTAVLTGWGLPVPIRAASPNTWKEVLQAIDGSLDVQGQQVAVQEYGMPNTALYEGLADRGARVLPVPVYRWALPDNLEPLQQAITAAIRGNFEVLLFTSAIQIQHVLSVADQMGVRTEWLAATQRCVVGSVGPTCSTALAAAGLPVSVEADPPKMGPLVRAAIAAAADPGSRTIPAKSPNC